MMTILMICLTAFAAVICGGVILIKLGGWLATLSAILIICHFFVSTAIIIILAADAETDKRKRMKEEAKKL